MPSTKSSIGAFAGILAAATVAIMLQQIFGSYRSRAAPANAPNIPNFINNETSSSPVCLALNNALPGLVYTSQSPVYQASMSSYFSQHNSQKTPACIVRPQTVHQVSAALKTLDSLYDGTSKSVQVAIRSGGHAYEAGFSSLDGGVVIDLSLINEIDVGADRQSTRIGTAAKWVEVTSKLDGMGLAVAGGRNSNVGVGGLTLGGRHWFGRPLWLPES